MAGKLQPLVNNQAIVRGDGTPTDYFIRWAQQRQIDITTAITKDAAEALIEAALADYVQENRRVNSGTGLTGGGDLSTDRTLRLQDTMVVPGVYGSSTKVTKITVDAQGRLTDVEEIPISGGGGGVLPVVNGDVPPVLVYLDDGSLVYMEIS